MSFPSFSGFPAREKISMAVPSPVEIRAAEATTQRWFSFSNSRIARA